MQVTIQSSMLTVTDVDRSIEFDKGVFGFRRWPGAIGSPPSWLDERTVPRSRCFEGSTTGFRPTRGGAVSGIRVLAFEVASVDELEEIRQN